MTDCKSEPKLHVIHDPASQLRLKVEVKIVRHMIDRSDWKGVSETAR